MSGVPKFGNVMEVTKEESLSNERVLRINPMRAQFRWALAVCTMVCGGMLSFELQAADCVPAPAGMVGCWPADGNANDIVGTNNGTFLNGEAFDTGEVGQAFSFDGSGNNVMIPAASSLDVGAGNGLTIETWINPANVSSIEPICEWALNGTYGAHFGVAGSSAGSLFANLFGTDNHSHIIESASGILVNDVFQHVAVTYDKPSGIARLFLNGVMIQQAALGSFTPRTSSDLYIGYRPNGSPFGPIPFTGLIDEVALYSRGLSAPEIQAIYNAGAAGKCIPAPLPPLSIARSGSNITLYWPGWATNFGLQVAEGSLSATWTNLPANPVVTNNQNLVTLPLTNAPKFFRLYHP